MNYDTMPAAREMDALVAEWVMGYSDIRRVRCERCGMEEPDYHYHLPNPMDLLNEPELRPTLCIPKYSTDIAAAWMVVEKLSHKFVYIQRWAGLWAVKFADTDAPSKDGWSTYEALPVLICRAALKAVSAIKE